MLDAQNVLISRSSASDLGPASVSGYLELQSHPLQYEGVSRQDALGTNSTQEESSEVMGVSSRVQGSNLPTSTETQFLKIPTVEGHLSSQAGRGRAFSLPSYPLAMKGLALARSHVNDNSCVYFL